MPDLELNCPLPLQYDQIVMAHGGGGRLMRQLLDSIIQPVFSNPVLNQKHDSAVLNINGSRLAFTTDSYVVKPLFFAGGDIGKLAVCGTLNDLAMSGALPLYISCSLIIEEGFAIKDLQRIVQSMQQTAQQAGVLIVTGDTKVVEHGSGDGVYINTAGIGIIGEGINSAPAGIQAGDSIIINSDLARHGIAVMLEREGMNFESTLQSDCADLSGLVQGLIQAGIDIHCMRDLTRGGLASCLMELADASHQAIEINETALPIREDVKSACEILGFDPIYIANEGCFALFVPEAQTEKTLAVLREHPLGQQACSIGRVKAAHPKGLVTLQTAMGISRVLDLLSGEQLPRIC
ncbi:carbamoyl phosphate phosphatase, hydrogenase 3 maturation protein [Candidatus Methylobacter favarea]|uniref:Carbamoyl phosphate phosphatase, hydrogenase 3 maturation protein n=1 Tax=Candidatus Methylobacter favarea TaxID=2707345 RepID=A0A8S0XIH0_9GAMM|nr:hydrogenase expression/formation protein HypE [Candidatus Methylobacter favarea]CAA9890736.1 carbamoyl phosphate phosphatase, hydrogenase 3 maturation protein [Candidatus Methylobacter favarea]